MTVQKSSAHPAHGRDDTVEVHYAGLERLRPCACYEGFVYVGHLVEGEDGEETEIFEPVPCRRAWIADSTGPGL